MNNENIELDELLDKYYTLEESQMSRPSNYTDSIILEYADNCNDVDIIKKNTIIWREPVYTIIDEELLPKSDKIRILNAKDLIEFLEDYSVFNKGQTLKIYDDNNIIRSIKSNSEDILYINHTVNKRILSKKTVYYISFLENGSGFLNIEFRNPHVDNLIVGFYTLDSPDSIELGVCINSVDNKALSFWTSDVYLVNKKINTSYYTLKSIEDLENIKEYTDLCLKLGVTCNININMVVNSDYDILSYEKFLDIITNLNNSSFVNNYIENFKKIIIFLKNNTEFVLDTTIIFEPFLLFNIYNFCKTGEILNPENIKCCYTLDDSKNTLVNFIKEINNICKKENIKLSHVVSISCVYKNLLESFEEYSDIDISKHFYNVQEEALKIVTFYKFFIEPDMSYLTFIPINEYSDNPWNNDSWLTFLLYIKFVIIRFSEHFYDLKVILFQLSCGHINESLCKSVYTNKEFENHTDKILCDLQDTASLFFLGGKFKLSEKNKYYIKDNWDDSKHIKHLDDTSVEITNHLDYMKEMDIFSKILFGPVLTNGVNPTPSEKFRVSDHNYTISKIIKVIFKQT